MTVEQRTLFLAEMRLTANVAMACSAARVSYRAALSERSRSREFERSWRACQEVASEAAKLRAEKARAQFRAYASP